MPRIRTHACQNDLQRLSLGRNAPSVASRQRDEDVGTMSKSGLAHVRSLFTGLLYRRRPCRIENMCGKLGCLVDKRHLNPVLVKSRTLMGVQENVYNVHGNGTFMASAPEVMHFKGCQNMEGVYALAESMGIEGHPPILVRMVVISACTGCFMNVMPNGAVTKILHDFGIRTLPGIESCNPVRFCLSKNNWAGELYPKNNDWTITARGSVIARMTFDFVEWTEAVEKDLLDCCEHMTRLVIQSVEASCTEQKGLVDLEKP